MKKKLSKFFIIMGAICLTLITLSSTQVQATIQSNPNTHYKRAYAPSTWMTNFRNMEITGGVLGLSEGINETTMVATSESNNLDSHMMKSTEYGAIAILSASGYGNPKTLQESTIRSTTGNETGVFFNTGSSSYTEIVAGGLKGAVFSNVDGRYYDAYEDEDGDTYIEKSSVKKGDALGTANTTNPGCTGWHLANNADLPYGAYPYLIRNYTVGIFAYQRDKASENYTSRGVVVCGEGL